MIHSFKYCTEKIGEVGEVSQTNDFLVTITGLKNAKIGEGVTFENETHGYVISSGKTGVLAVVLSRVPIEPKTKAALTGGPLSISAGEGLLGHMINTLGHSLTTRRQKSYIEQKRPIEISPSGISGRARISRFFETGIAVGDLLIPLGSGQRELIIGDRQSGKTHYLLETMLTQAERGAICIYCAIGKRKSEIKLIDKFLEQRNILEQSIIVAADSYSSPGEVYLAPYAAMTISEYFRDQEKDVVLILDDLTTHAKYYREIGLLANYMPGRESYPGDIFHSQSKLLERAGSFVVNGKEAAITCLPVAETTGGDLTGYIQTNLMSMTDGHLYFDSEEYSAGRRPPINVFLSVTRVGRQTQSMLLRDIGYKLSKLMKQYEYTKRFLRFETELSSEVRQTLERGESLTGFFNQIGYFLIPSAVSVYAVALIWQGLYKSEEIKSYVEKYNQGKIFKTRLDRIVERAKTLEEFIALTEKGFNYRV